MNIFAFILRLFSRKKEEAAPVVPAVPVANKKTAICMAINDYPGTQNDLQGCINDCSDWANYFKSKKFNEVVQMKDREVTKSNVISTLKKYVSEAKDGDVLVVTYSGHGSSVPDTNGDEEDSKDETLYLYDGNLIDDTLRDIMSKLSDNVHFTFISDSCHSATVTRSMLLALESGSYSKVRYMPPMDDCDAANLETMSVNKKVLYAEDSVKGILLAGCQANEYSYDAEFNGKANGAFTYYALDVLKKAMKDLTYKEFYKLLRESLPSRQHPQTPALEGKDENKNRIMFT